MVVGGLMAGYGGCEGSQGGVVWAGEAALDPAGRRLAGFAMGIASSREEAFDSCFACAR